MSTVDRTEFTEAALNEWIEQRSLRLEESDGHLSAFNNMRAAVASLEEKSLAHFKNWLDEHIIEPQEVLRDSYFQALQDARVTFVGKRLTPDAQTAVEMQVEARKRRSQPGAASNTPPGIGNPNR
jgi:hypothetical protein